MKRTFLTLIAAVTLLCAVAPAVLAQQTVPETRPDMNAPVLPIPNARQPFPGVLTGGQPSPQQLEEAARLGYRVVIDLREPDERDWDEAAEVTAHGMRYVSIPVGGAHDVTVDKARELAAALGAATGQPVIVHCGSGNRVGALFALKARFLDGETAEKAIEIGRAAGLAGLEAHVRLLLTEGGK